MPTSPRTLLCSAATVATLLASQLACGGGSLGSGDVDAGAGDAGPEADAAIVVSASVCLSEPGTRLTREFIEPATGATQEFDILDSEIGEPCAFSVEADGSYSCYPSDFGGQIFFQDAGCTTAIVAVGLGSEPKTFARARRFSDGGCFLAKHFRRIGLPSAVIGGQDVFRQDTSGTCVAATSPNRDFYLAGAELPISSFVTASREVASGSGRLATATFEGTDGSSLCDTSGVLVDNTLGQDCRPGLGVDEELYCMPSGGSASDIFTNAGCTETTLALTVDRCQEEPLAYVQSLETLTCGNVAATLRNVETTALAQRFEQVDELCVADSGTDRFFPIGDEVANSEFVPLSAALEDGSERLQRQLLTGGDDFVSFGGLWHDNTLDVDCRFAAAVDGSLRCLPETLTSSNFFSDAMCTASITLAEIDGCQDGLEHFALAGTLGTRVLASAPHSEPVFEREGAACVPASGSFLVPGFELAPTSFVEATISER